MRVELLNKEDYLYEFKYERSQGSYNNVNIDINLKPYWAMISSFNEKQLNKFAFDEAKKEAIRVFEVVEPMYNEIDELVNFEIESYKLPEGKKTNDLPPTPTREELDSIIDDQLMLIEEISFLREKVTKLTDALKKKGVIDENFGQDEDFSDGMLDENLSDLEPLEILEEE